MKIGYDAKRIFQNSTGLGNYSRTLVNNLAKFHPQYDIHLFAPKLNENRTDFQKKYTVHTPSNWLLAYWRTFGMTKDIERQNIDIYHGLSHELPSGIHRSKAKSILTVHDLIFKIHPKQYQPLDRKMYDLKLKYACEAADKIIAISEHTKKDIIKYYKTASEKIEVIYQTCDDIFFEEKTQEERQTVLQKFNLPTEYLFYVGSVIERKNLLTLVKALPKTTTQIPLVVIGGGKNYKKEVEKYITENQLQQRVIFLKNVANEDLPALYQQAKIFIYPSMYEGFGIPVIEAIFSKTPVITTSHSALPEAGGEFSYYINGKNAEELSAMIDDILQNENEVNIRVNQAYEAAQRKFSPIITSQKLHQLYQSV